MLMKLTPEDEEDSDGGTTIKNCKVYSGQGSSTYDYMLVSWLVSYNELSQISVRYSREIAITVKIYVVI